MIAGRAADPALQFTLFSKGYAAEALVRVGLLSPAKIANLIASREGAAGIASIGPVPTLLVGMYAVAALRHSYWATFTNKTYFPPKASFAVSFLNGAVNTLNTLICTYTLATAAPNASSGWSGALGWRQLVGAVLFATGIALEVLSEEMRKRFKAEPANKGKVHGTGLFRIVRHPNYLGYLLWRVGITLAAGSPRAALAMGLIQAGFFSLSIPELEAYMKKRYGEEWEEHRARVPYKMIPGIF
ncbi:hypothetical protein FISHEDRAFT_65603 [Fistulina hepatica ATCC 64428]|uniref:Uncharacterized protein n=1 Tax=Fistulina hepatica ATCC 64428 TaxID=1128425 RepID=A0A0D7ABK0_9AGAR|nr:hypothetical protein FISHEDRAFT_65764 [Fistulina hepatica ATCC 64428]KIY48776.1 hypothetical protein FISHEDRAFT_65603 [Fistulina hepatica ATCC 64428]